MKLFIVLCLSTFSMFSFAKTSNEKKLYELKINQEQELIKIKGKTDFSFFSSNKENPLLNLKSLESMECIEWVYRGSASRAEAIAACKGVYSLQCLE